MTWFVNKDSTVADGLALHLKFAIAFSTLLVSGCATLPESACDAQEWAVMGKSDAIAGQPHDQVNQRAKECAAAGIYLDRRRYLQGRRAGLVLHCTPREGAKLGHTLRPAVTDCPVEQDDAYRRGYLSGARQVRRETIEAWAQVREQLYRQRDALQRESDVEYLTVLHDQAVAWRHDMAEVMKRHELSLSRESGMVQLDRPPRNEVECWMQGFGRALALLEPMPVCLMDGLEQGKLGYLEGLNLRQSEQDAGRKILESGGSPGQGAIMVDPAAMRRWHDMQHRLDSLRGLVGYRKMRLDDGEMQPGLPPMVRKPQEIR